MRHLVIIIGKKYNYKLENRKYDEEVKSLIEKIVDEYKFRDRDMMARGIANRLLFKGFMMGTSRSNYEYSYELSSLPNSSADAITNIYQQDGNAVVSYNEKFYTEHGAYYEKSKVTFEIKDPWKELSEKHKINQ